MFRLKRTEIPGVPDAVRVSVELADEPFAAAAPSPATTPPAPVPDIDEHLTAIRRAAAIRDARNSELCRLVDEKQHHLAQMQRDLTETRQRLQRVMNHSGRLEEIRADRDRLDAANGVLVERVRELEKQLAETGASA